MTGSTILPRPQGATSSGFLLDLVLAALESLSSGKASSTAAAETEALASAFSAASSDALSLPGGGASGAGSIVAIGVAPKSGTSAETMPFCSVKAFGAGSGARAAGATAPGEAAAGATA